MVDNPEILFIDDSKTSRQLARKILGEKYSIHTCNNGQQGWDVLRSNPGIQIVFSDIEMDTLNGLQLLQLIRKSTDQHIANLPVVMITGAADNDATMRAVFEMGATDFVSKPFKTMDLISRAYSYITLNSRISKLERSSETDTLTGLYNLTGMKTNAIRHLAFSHRHKASCTFAELAITQYTELTSKHGAGIAKQVLKQFAVRLQKTLRKEDITARVGRSRFAILLPSCNQIKARSTISRIQKELQSIIFECGTGKFNIKVAAGITSYSGEQEISFDELMLQTDSALQTSISSANTTISSYQGDLADDVASHDATEHHFTESLIHILEGNFHKIDRLEIAALIEKLEAFINYNNNNPVTESEN